MRPRLRAIHCLALLLASVPSGLSGQEAPGRSPADSSYSHGSGFPIAESEVGELRLQVYSYVRYLAQSGLESTYIDAFGDTTEVRDRHDVQVNKVNLAFAGWLLDPKLTYLFYIWTNNPAQGLPAQVSVNGYLSYQVSSYLTVSGGIGSLPGVRSTDGTFPYWLTLDNRTIADEFFRPSYTQGFWAKGEIVPGLRYAAMIGNNLSQLGVDAGQLDNGFNTVSGRIAWYPTTGEFGHQDQFGDFDEHEELAIRLAGHFTYSPENSQSQPDTDGFDNVRLRLSDGSVIFEEDLFAPGVRVDSATYHMASVDGGVKYRGFSLDAEHYWRWIDDLRGAEVATLPFEELRDHGFQVLASSMLQPLTLQLYVLGSKVFGEYGDPWEIRAGLNLYPWKNQVFRVNVELMHLERSPVGGLSLPYLVGSRGQILHINFSWTSSDELQASAPDPLIDDRDLHPLVAQEDPGRSPADSATAADSTYANGTAGELQPAKGFNLFEHPRGTLNISFYGLFRYLNQMPGVQTFTDHLGRERVVKAKHDLNWHRTMVWLSGFFYVPQFRYNITLWSLPTTQQTLLFGNMQYIFSRSFVLGVGIAPSLTARSMQGSWPFWAGSDRQMAEDFFRGGFSSGAFLTGQPASGLSYTLSVNSNLSQLGVTATNDTRDMAYSASLSWMPTTGEFGPRGGLGDLEHHEELATRFGISANHTRESRYAADSVPPNETQIRMADGVSPFERGALAEGVVVRTLDYDEMAVDAGFKYKGFSFQGEYYWRQLSDFKADGPLPLESMLDHGFMAEAMYMVAPRLVGLYVVSGFVFDDFERNPWELGGGLSYYPARNRSWRVNLHFLHVEKSPAGSNFGYYSAGQTGEILSIGFDILL